MQECWQLLSPLVASSFISFQHFAPVLVAALLGSYDLHATYISIRVNQRNQHYCRYYTPQNLRAKESILAFVMRLMFFLYSPPPALAKAASKQLNNYVYVKNYNKIITALLTPMYLLQVLNLQYVAFQKLRGEDFLEDFVESLPLQLR